MTQTSWTHENVPAENWDYEGIYDADGREIAMTKEIGHAETIVHCVNCHADLIAALEMVIKNHTDIAISQNFKNCGCDDCNVLKLALQKAKGDL